MLNLCACVKVLVPCLFIAQMMNLRGCGCGLAVAFEKQGSMEEARKLFLESAEIWATALGDDHEKSVDARHRADTVGKDLEDKEGEDENDNTEAEEEEEEEEESG